MKHDDRTPVAGAPDGESAAPTQTAEGDVDVGALRAQAVSGVKWNGFATVTGAILQFLALAVLARLLDPRDFGLMSMAVVVTGFGNLFMDAGFGNAIIHRQDATRRELSTLYWLNVLVGLALFGAVFASTPLVSWYYDEPAVAPVLRWAAGVFLIAPWGQQFKSLLRREMRFRALSQIEIAQNLAYAVVAVLLAFRGLGVMSLVYATLARAVIATAALGAVAAAAGLLPGLRFVPADLERFRSFGLFQLAERSVNYIGNNVDYLIVGRFLGSEALGFYMLAYNIIRAPLQYLNPVVTSVAFPAFARVQDDDRVLRLGYRRIIRYLSGVTFPMMAGMMVVAPLFIHVFFGARWLPAAPVVQVFCLLGALKGIGNPTGSLLLAKGRADLGFYLNVVTLVGLTACNYIGVRWGIIGVAAGSALFILAMFPVGVLLRKYLIGLTLREYVDAFATALTASVVMIGLTLLVRWFLGGVGAPELQLGTVVATGVLTYAAALWYTDRSFFSELRGYLSTPAFEAGRG